MQYVPYLDLTTPSEYFKMKSCIEFLDKNIEELDFSNLIHYLEE